MTLLHGTNLKVITDQLIVFHKIMVDHGDEQNAEKLLELYHKSKDEEFIVSFAGHFSAGKSSMINALLEKDILPKSPIPTSANIVKISSGKGVAQVYFNHEEAIEYDEPYDMDMIKEYCKDKDTIKRIELSTGEPLMPVGCSIIDTPGIDAADDADRIITESSLHLVDVLFYVMDYNHVQSEVNLYFLKNIQEIGIPYYVIINQVDKHDENEIPFADYEFNIKQTFDQWNLKPIDWYYSSLVDEQASNNQFNRIKDKLHQQFMEHKSLLRTTGSAKQIIDQHRTFLEQTFEEQKSQFTNVTGSTELQERLTEIRRKIDYEITQSKEIEDKFKNDLNSTLKNAYLMPSSLRELAENFLESRQKDFKVGFIGSKKKTELEKQLRINDFLSELQKSIESNIQWKLREKFNKLLHESDLRDRSLAEQIPKLMINYTENDLLKHVKSGAQVNGDYILNYTNEISADIKNKFKQKTRILRDKIQSTIEKELEEKLSDYRVEKLQVEESLKEMHDYQTMKEAYYNKLEQLKSPGTITSDARELMNNRLDEITLRPSKVKIHQVKKTGATVKKPKDSNNMKASKETYTIESVNPLIEQTIQTVEDLPGFSSLIHDLKEKQTRLNNRRLTIALFGAFSAGKSSFANALLGENVLPVSPNPTTAVINRINPVTEKYSHGTVVIQIKDEETIVRDIRSITRHLSPTAKKLNQLIDWINQDELYQSNDLSNLFQNYLVALTNGYQRHQDLLGKEIIIPIEDFPKYVTDEKIACYMEIIDLYYDCTLTQQGITLVDTPGADSINARHTNVAFDYIKYADAILYVSYYNHALSRADKDFLMQLGRVKETFQLDKMFFIINAADLAQNDSELNLVNDYVEEQLVQLGIRFPKIHPVSSKRSLEEKLAQRILNDQMATFEDKLFEFINNGLATLTIEAALFDMKRITKTLNHFIKTASLDEQEKSNYKESLDKKKKKLIDTTNKLNDSLYQERITEKIVKQLHYVEERISIRFHDMFKEMFNPTTVTESGKKASIQLERNLKLLLDYVGFEILQEVRAVSLRIESYMYDLVKEVHVELEKKLFLVENDFLLPGLNKQDYHTPGYDQALTDMEVKNFSKALSIFKSTKSFFEKNEKEKMKEEIYRILIPNIKVYLKQCNQTMAHAYSTQWTETTEKIKSRVVDGIKSYIADDLSLMEDSIDLELLHERHQILDSILLEGK